MLDSTLGATQFIATSRAEFKKTCKWGGGGSKSGPPVGKWGGGGSKSDPPNTKIHSCTSEHANLPESSKRVAACEESSIDEIDMNITCNLAGMHSNSFGTCPIIFGSKNERRRTMQSKMAALANLKTG